MRDSEWMLAKGFTPCKINDTFPYRMHYQDHTMRHTQTNVNSNALSSTKLLLEKDCYTISHFAVISKNEIH